MPADLLGSSSPAHFASMRRGCFGSVGLRQVSNLLPHVAGISFEYTVSLLPHNLQMGPGSRFEYHTYKWTC
ncbi:unnamed protein product [Linum trigynum]|uniref:Uncharacterized protein n=1 Tax=Linum trigynum TaxID=586398 RepID=A0AAV2F1C2_9ROSI